MENFLLMVPKAPKIMDRLFINKKREILSISEIIENKKTIIGISFSYLFSEKIFCLKDKEIKIYPKDKDTIIAFSSIDEYERLNDHYNDLSVFKTKKLLWIGCNNKFQFHFPTYNLKEIDWE